MAQLDRRLLVDAMNVIGSRPTGWWRDRAGAVVELAGRLRRYAELSATDITLVIDGHPLDALPPGDQGRLRLCYAAAPGRDAADDRIVEILDLCDEPVTVVTADKTLRERASARGAELMGPRDFLRRLDEAEA